MVVCFCVGVDVILKFLTLYLNLFLPHMQGQTLLEAQQSTVQVFGRWQTEDYIAHPIIDVSCH